MPEKWLNIYIHIKNISLLTINCPGLLTLYWHLKNTEFRWTIPSLCSMVSYYFNVIQIKYGSIQIELEIFVLTWIMQMSVAGQSASLQQAEQNPFGISQHFEVWHWLLEEQLRPGATPLPAKTLVRLTKHLDRLVL